MKRGLFNMLMERHIQSGPCLAEGRPALLIKAEIVGCKKKKKKDGGGMNCLHMLNPTPAANYSSFFSEGAVCTPGLLVALWRGNSKTEDEHDRFIRFRAVQKISKNPLDGGGMGGGQCGRGLQSVGGALAESAICASSTSPPVAPQNRHPLCWFL